MIFAMLVFVNYFVHTLGEDVNDQLNFCDIFWCYLR